MEKTIFFLVVLFLVFPVNARSSSIQPLKDLDALAMSATWLKLLHFKNGQGQIKTNRFYLSKTGRTDAREELKATIDKMLEPDDTGNQHAQCLFRARYYWLSSHPFWKSLNAPVIHCPKYEQWSDEANIQSVSIILATGYLSNPASFFGHMLLKFNNKSEVTNTNLLDISVNYGAVVPPDENAIVYILKGLFGGYDARYTEGAYYRFNHSYTNIDQRDVWEYRLNLGTEETRLVLAHSWELQNNEFSYFYLTKNCAYRIAELLELVLDGTIKPRESPWVMPVEIFRELSSYKHQGKPLVTTVKRILSRQNQFYEKLETLSFREKQLLTAIIKNNIVLTSPSYLELENSSRIKIVDTLFDYYEINIKESNKTADKESKRRLFIEMLALSSATRQPDWKFKEKRPPHYSRKPGVLSFGAFHDSDYGSGTLFKFRPAYFDMLTPDTGKMPFAKLYMMNIEIDHVNDSTQLRKLDIVDIETLSLPKSGLPGDDAYAWKLSFGWDRPDLSCQDCIVGNLEGGIGHSIQVKENVALFGYIEGRYQTKKQGYETFAVGSKVGAVVNVTDFWRFKLSLTYKDYIGTDNDPDNVVRIENRLGNFTHWDVRLLYEKQSTEIITASVGYYFN